MVLKEATNAEIEARALAAAFRTMARSQRAGQKIDPRRAPVRAETRTVDGLKYVRVLTSTGVPVEIYRLRPRGELKRMVRPPIKLRQ